jgi:hypothetical protein
MVSVVGVDAVVLVVDAADVVDEAAVSGTLCGIHPPLLC